MFIIEVQHSSDHNKDGKWFELDRFDNPIVAGLHMLRYKYVSPKRPGCSGSYAGRPLRVREL